MDQQSRFRKEGNFTVRGLSQAVFEWLELEAKRRNRSMTGTIRAILNEAMYESLSKR